MIYQYKLFNLLLILFFIIIYPVTSYAGDPDSLCPTMWGIYGDLGPRGHLDIVLTPPDYINYVKNNYIAVSRSLTLYSRATDIDEEVCPGKLIKVWIDDCDYRWDVDQKDINGNWNIVEWDEGIEYTYNVPDIPNNPITPYSIRLLGKDHGKFGTDSRDYPHYPFLNPPEPTSDWVFIESIEPLNVVIPDGEENHRLDYHEWCATGQYGKKELWRVNVYHSSQCPFRGLELNEEVTLVENCGININLQTGSTVVQFDSELGEFYGDKIGFCNEINYQMDCDIVARQVWKIGPVQVPYITNKAIIHLSPLGLDFQTTSRMKWPEE